MSASFRRLFNVGCFFLGPAPCHNNAAGADAHAVRESGLNHFQLAAPLPNHVTDVHE